MSVLVKVLRHAPNNLKYDSLCSNDSPDACVFITGETQLPSDRVSLDSWNNQHQLNVFLQTKFGRLPRVSITRESRLPRDEYVHRGFH